MKKRIIRISDMNSKRFRSLRTSIVFLLILQLFFNYTGAFAEDVDILTAKNVAINLYNERVDNAVFNIGISSVIEEKENGETVFYVLKYTKKGFAIIAANDIFQPVLGYSFESDYDENDHSPAFDFFIIKRFKKQIYAAKQAKISPDTKTTNEWNKYSINPTSFQPESVKSFVPLLSTIWGQGLYFNTQCPVDLAGPDGHALVGCVATAMAQVLNYWQHPWHGTGSHSYTPDKHPEYGVQSANFADAIYNFDNMPDEATNYCDDLAELMYHCAVSVDMDFGPDASGASGWGNNDISNAFKDYFYINDNVNDLNRSSFPGTWIDKMKENLDQNRPIIYGARDNQNDAGHAWVLDAYTTGDMFHCNWGWYGNNNGWFSIDDFSVAGYTFDDLEHACVRIYPHSSHVNGTWDLAGSPYYLNYDLYVDPGDQLIIEPGVDVIYTGRYKLEVQGKLEAIGTASDSITFLGENSEVGMRGVRFLNTNNYPDDSSTIDYCRFYNGKAFTNTVNEYTAQYLNGGAIYCDNSAAVLITNSRFFSNRADKGGAIYCGNSSDIFIGECLIENNRAGTGGGIRCDHSNPEIINSIIRLNTGYDVSSGGGMACTNSSPVVSDVVITENSVTNNGGGIYCTDNSDISLTNVEISKNTAKWGGGMEVWWQCTPTLTNVTIYDNDAENDGGGILIESANPIITNSIIRANKAINGRGGGIYCSVDGKPYIYGTQIDINDAEYGGGYLL